MNIVAMMHDNGIYGLTKKQVSPTSPKGLKSNTTPQGAYLAPLNPTSTTLGVQNVSFVAQTVAYYSEATNEMSLVDGVSIRWPGGALPPDVPHCGFRGDAEHCRSDGNMSVTA